MDHTPYKKQKQHEQQLRPSPPPQSTNNDMLKDAGAMTGRFSGLQRQAFPDEPTKIGVTYRTRRKRHYNNQWEDSDVSVISYNSQTTFGRFSQLSQVGRILDLPVPETQRYHIQQSNQQSSQPATGLVFSKFSPRSRPSTIGSPSTLHDWKTIDNLGSNKQVTNTLQTDHDHSDAEENDDMEMWTTVSNGKSWDRVQQSPPYPTKYESSATKQQQKAPYVGDSDSDYSNINIDRNSKYFGDDQGGLQPQPLPSTNNIVVSDSEDEGSLDLNRLQSTFKPLPRFKDEQIMKTLSWAVPNLTDDIGSQNEHRNLPQTAAKLDFGFKKHTRAPITIDDDERHSMAQSEADDDNEMPQPLSQKALGKIPLYGGDVNHSMDQSQQDASPMDKIWLKTHSPVIETKKQPSPSPISGTKKRSPSPVSEMKKRSPPPVNETKKRSPSVVSFHMADIDGDYDNGTKPIPSALSPTTIEQEKKLPSPILPSIDYGADALDMFDTGDLEDLDIYGVVEDKSNDNEEQSQHEAISDIPRINTHANPTRELIENSRTHTKKNFFPISLTRSIFESALPSNMTMKGQNSAALTEATNLFFDQLCGDLEAYAEHAGKFTIDEEDMELLMSRQRLLTENTSLEALAHEHLPRELWDELCVSAMADNYLYPKRE